MFTITRKSLLTEYKALIHQLTPNICTLTFQSDNLWEIPWTREKSSAFDFLTDCKLLFYLSARYDPQK